MNQFARKIPTGPMAQMANAVVVVGALGYVGYNAVFTVEGGHRAIVFNRFVGIKEQTYTEGMVSVGVMLGLGLGLIYGVRVWWFVVVKLSLACGFTLPMCP